jgi:hypothetical protein
MRTRSKAPHNRKYFHTNKKYDKRDSTSIKKKVHKTQQQKEESLNEHLPIWKFRRYQRK